MEYLKKLNDRQRKAALHTEGPLLILAGAGSGKTSTMTHRIAYLIKEKKVSPYNILAVTFTNKAADEMRDRVEALIGSHINMWIATFHSACLRILRKNADRLGFKSGFSVYDPSDQKIVLRAIVKERALDEKKFSLPFLMSQISKAKEDGLEPEEYGEYFSEHPIKNKLADVYADYQAKLRKNNAMDFDDLIYLTVKLFKNNPDVLDEYRERFKYIMVDEYQDTNKAQYEFIRLLSEKHRNLCVVGDDDQCIYVWRGANIENILNFEHDFKGAEVIKLEQNYRSHANILDAANSVIVNNMGRKDKKLWTDGQEGDKVVYFSSYDEREEARDIGREINKLLETGYNYSDIAILYRTNVQSRPFEDQFGGFSIPYRVVGGVRYYDRKEIRDMLSYMRLVANPDDNVSLVRIINEPKRGIGAKSIEKISSYANTMNISLFDALKNEDIVGSLPTKAESSIKTFMELINQYVLNRDDMAVEEIYDSLLIETGYLATLEAMHTVEADSRIENLLEFKSVIESYKKDNPEISLFEFLEKISLLSDIDNHDRSENAVTLMTLHSAKGLEFPVVFMPGMETGLFPSWRSYDTPDGIDEERRLCYVGMTRAMRKLYLSSAKSRTIYGKYNKTKESIFLEEIDKDFLEGGELIGHKDHKTGANDGFASKQVFSPFDRVKEMKKELKDKAAKKEEKLGLKMGDRVKHKSFGQGLVLKADDKIVEIMFDELGLKKLVNDSRSPIELIK